MDKQKIQVYLCPHCGHRTSIRREHVIKTEEKSHHGEILKLYRIICLCMNCDNILIFESGDWLDNPYDLYEGKLIYPKVEVVSEFIPHNVRNSYLEAKKVEKISNIAYTVMIRRALEFLCIDQKAEGKTLDLKITDLSKKKIIPDVLAEMSDALRILGNIGAHATETNLYPHHIEAINDFFNALIEYVYIGPNKLKKFKETIGRPPISRRSSN